MVPSFLYVAAQIAACSVLAAASHCGLPWCWALVRVEGFPAGLPVARHGAGLLCELVLALLTCSCCLPVKLAVVRGSGTRLRWFAAVSVLAARACLHGLHF